MQAPANVCDCADPDPAFEAERTVARGGPNRVYLMAAQRKPSAGWLPPDCGPQ